jgi:serine/threonine protein kinase
MTLVSGRPASGGLPPAIGRYRVTARIGKGAMGMVYAGVDDSLGRNVAIKVMMADLEEAPEIRERFYREAKITGQLNHRNIVTVFDLGEDDGHPFIVMELLEGQALSDYLHNAPDLGLDGKIALMIQMCDGLQIAHARHVIHRDIKPSNLFVQRDGTLKILDFGVARLQHSNLTASGFLMGTPEFMAPEQACGRPVDGRSDIFAAAGVFYYMLTNRPPFSGPDLPKMLHAIINEDPRRPSDAEAPESLYRVLKKALAKDPAERYQQCLDLAADLDRARKTYQAAAHRTVDAALERYRQILAVIEERRKVGREIGKPEIDSECDDALKRLAARYPEFAKRADRSTLVEPLDPDVAAAALPALQTKHNAELGTLAVLRDQAAARATEKASDGANEGLLNRAAHFLGLGRAGEPRQK